MVIILSFFIKVQALKIAALERLEISKKGKSAENAKDHAAGDKSLLESYHDAFKKEKTKNEYLIRLGYFFNTLKIPGDSLNSQTAEFLNQASSSDSNNKYAKDCVMTFIRHLKDRINSNDLSGGTLKNYYFAVKLFYQANDIQLNWKWIQRGLPPASTVANDRIPP